MNEQSEDSGENGGRITQPQPPLVTSRLILRRPEPEDAPAIVSLADNMRIAQQTRRMPHPYRLRDAEDWIAAIRSASLRRAASLLMTCKTRRTVLGTAGYAEMEEDGEVEIGYWVGEPHWGKSFATEAAQAIIDHVLIGSFERINGRCRSGNPASRRVLEKCGFQYSGSGMCGCRALNSTVPSDDFVLERFVWVSLKRWGAA